VIEKRAGAQRTGLRVDQPKDRGVEV
jgi:hypothetical protein